MKENTITIHQPDFMPWLGFFDKINNADTWVILDHVENNPRDANFWGRRVKVIVNNQEFWLSVTLKKEKNKVGIPINQMQIIDSSFKILTTIEQAYKKTIFFADIFPLINTYFTDSETSLVKRNLIFINSVLSKLDIEKTIIYSSDLLCTQKSTELLIEIIKKINGTTYLAGGGAQGYQDDKLFRQNGIELKYNNFKHPVYKQNNIKGPFIDGLSIIDALMNIGFDGVRELLNTK